MGRSAFSNHLEELKLGNLRYQNRRLENKNPDHTLREKLATHGQKPLAAIIGCADSRVPVEIIFDQPLGSLFVIRSAGNTAFPEALASLEYAYTVLQTPLILVLGHTGCGAIQAALTNQSLDSSHQNLKQLLEHISSGIKNCSEVDDAVWINAKNCKNNIIGNSTVLREAHEKNLISIHTAVYDLKSGSVSFEKPHPETHLVLDKKGGDCDSLV